MKLCFWPHRFRVLAVIGTIFVTGLCSDARGSSDPLHFSNLRITEIMHDPVEGASFADDDYEYLEFHNQGATTLDFSGFSFSDGITLSFADGTELAAGAFMVVAKTPAAFQERYGFLPVNDIGYSGRLRNSGERVALQNASGTEVLALEFSSDAPHLQLASGGGFSLVPVDPRLIPTSLDDWRVSSQRFGSPGQEDETPVQADVAAVKVNEVLAHTDLPQVDFIELHNPSAETADVGGWYITDNLSNPTRFRIPSGTQIPAGGYLVVDETELGFAFFSEGDSAYVVAADGSGALTGYSHGFDFGATPNGFSLGRCVTRSGLGDLTEHFVLQESVTRGDDNQFPLIGPVVISEIFYQPTASDEFVELTNLASSATPLYDADNPENRWRLTGIGTFTVTAGTTLAANGTLLIVPIEPELFRAQYDIPDSVQVQGPYSGRLSDNGEKIALQRPDRENQNGTVPYYDVDVVTYGTSPPWPSVQVHNKSLERIIIDDFGDSPLNWTASASAGGSPGDSMRSVQKKTGSRNSAAARYPRFSRQMQDNQQTYLPLVARIYPPLASSCFHRLNR